MASRNNERLSSVARFRFCMLIADPLDAVQRPVDAP